MGLRNEIRHKIATKFEDNFEGKIKRSAYENMIIVLFRDNAIYSHEKSIDRSVNIIMESPVISKLYDIIFNMMSKKDLKELKFDVITKALIDNEVPYGYSNYLHEICKCLSSVYGVAII